MKRQQKSMLQEAIRYHKLGYCVIPLKGSSKEPLIEWKEYQQKRSTIDEIRRWWERWPDANIGIVTGRSSGIIVLDVDGPTGEEFIMNNGGLPDTPKCRTAKGHQYYVGYPSDSDVGCSANKELQIDIKAEGGYVVAPPSIHPSGDKYFWIKGFSPWKIKPAPLSECKWLAHYIEDRGRKKEDHIGIEARPVDWENVSNLIATKPSIVSHLKTPNPGDRSGHDWRLPCLCLEEGIDDERMLYQIILNNPMGKAGSRTDKRKYIEDVILRSKNKFKLKNTVNNPFPKETIQGLSENFADLHSNYFESPWPFWVFSFLACLGNVLTGHVTLDCGLSLQPRLFVTILGESADDRKSESVKQTLSLFKESFPTNFHSSFGAGSAEGLIRQFQSKPNLLFALDEFNALFGKSKIPGSTLIECVATLFENTRYESITKNKSIVVDPVFLSVVGV